MKIFWLCTLLSASSAIAAWIDSPRYGKDYVDARSYRIARCIPCEQRTSHESTYPQSNALEYRGNGADNLGYDWSPKAWGGRAFPPKEEDKGQFPADNWNSRDGRRMPWNDKCRDCERSKNWGPYDDTKGNSNQYGDKNSPTHRPDNWSASTDRPQSYVGNSGAPTDGFSTVTSSVLGVRLRDDKRLPVEWSEDGRNMRWDGFRNGMPWSRPDTMDRRDDGYRPWDRNNQGSTKWNQDGKGHYASDWNYGDRNPDMSRPNSFDQRPWANRWSDKNEGNGGGYNQGHSNQGYPFGSSYPSTDRYPDKPSYSPSTPSPHPSKPSYNYPTSSRPQSEYPPPRPNYEIPNRPFYQTTSNPYKPQSEPAPWTYRPEQQPWTTPRPQQNYLPQSNRPDYSYRPTNNRPNTGTPSTAIWNGRPNENRPGDFGQRPQGFYTGFITEINDPNYGGNGNRHPSDRPYSGSSYDKNYYDRNQGNNNIQGSRYPNYNGNSFSTNNDRYPNPQPAYERPYEGNRNPGYDTRPNRYPETNNYDNRNPNSGYDYPNKYPSYNSGSNRDRDRDWNYNNDNRDYNGKPPYGSGSNGYPSRPNPDSGSWNYGDEDKEGSYRRSGGSYPLYKGGQYFTSSYLASASTPAAAAQDPPNNKSTDETTVASSQE